MEEVTNEQLLHRYTGATIALARLYESLAEIQLFTISDLWPEGSMELDAAADTLEGVKALIAKYNVQIKAAVEELIDGDSEE